jgi:hypothetical protein
MPNHRGFQPQICRWVSVSKEARSFVLRASFLSISPIEREKRVGEAMALFQRFGEQALGVNAQNCENILSFRFDQKNEQWLLRAARRLEQRIGIVLTAPLSPKAVDHALGITTRERIRWYKDGRLPISNFQTIGHGRQRVRVPFFVFDEIEKLRSSPETIEGWRRDDGDKLDPPSARLAST